MRILVCFKVTPDFEALREADWVAGAAGVVETKYARRILNCFDEAALELALRLSDSLTERGAPAVLAALSVGGREADPHLKTLSALGYERAARVDLRAALVDPGAALDFAPAVIASIVAGYVGQLGDVDLLLLGYRSGPGDSGVVPFLVAEALGWPCLTQVTDVGLVSDVGPVSDDRVRVTCMADDGLLRLTVRPPCVMAVGNAVVSHLRVPTLSDRLATKDRGVDVLDPADLGVDVAGELAGQSCVPAGLERIERQRRGVIIAGDTPREKARALFDTYLKDEIEKL